MHIRMAQEKDLPEINKLLYQVCMVHHNGRPDLFRAGAKKYTDSELITIINDKNTPVLVAADESDIVRGYAFCVFQEHKSGSMTDIKTLYIDDLCVDEDCRGQHIGTLLYNAVLEFARKNKCYNVTLNVWSCNESAMKFYEKCGLKPQKVGMEKIL